MKETHSFANCIFKNILLTENHYISIQISPKCIAMDHMGLVPDTWNCGLRMRRERRDRFPPLLISKKTTS